MLYEEVGQTGSITKAKSRHPHPRLARPRRDPEARRLAILVASELEVKLTVLFGATRGPARAAYARQLAMYLVHVVLSRPQQQVGDFFRRDRTTVAHACQKIEDARDDAVLDAQVATIEARWAAMATGDMGRGNA